MKIFSWDDILKIESGINHELFKNGSAISVGSFDGPHIGHNELFYSVLKKAKKHSYVAGLVTFSQSLGQNKSNDFYKGDVSTLNQRLNSFIKLSMDFCIVIDFSIDFGKMNGEHFLSILKNACNLKFLAEGVDFRCGYRGLYGINEISNFAKCNNIETCFLPDVMYFGKRVSSSRIRSCVSNADFVSAENMLLHPYELDLTNVLLQKEENFLIADRQHFFQVLPENGIYNVHIITANANVLAKLYVEPLFLRLEVPNFNFTDKIMSVAFIGTSKKLQK